MRLRGWDLRERHRGGGSGRQLPEEAAHFQEAWGLGDSSRYLLCMEQVLPDK